MKRLIFLFFLINITTTAFTQKSTDKRLLGLDSLVNKILKDWKAPGVSIAVVEKNKIIFAGGYGYRDLENKLPVTENTLFAIGSCTKAFTASMLGMLAKDEIIELDKPVRNYLPELRFYNDHLNAAVTIRDMMSHRTGLPRHDYSWYGSDASRMELLKRIEFLKPTADLREKYQYNNFMYMAQGVLIEKLTGKSWETNISSKIFVPLGMNQTVTTTADLVKSTDASKAYAIINDSFAKNIPYRNIDAIGPAGSIASSARDMAKWLQTWIYGGKYNGKEIIPSAYTKMASTPQMVTGGYPSAENPDIQPMGYGLAWGMSSYRSHYRVEHSGGIDGFSTSTSFFPFDSLGIYVVSCNGSVTTSIRNYIADKMLGLSFKDWHKQQRDPFVKARFAALMSPKPNDSINILKNTKPSLALQEYQADYSHPGYGKINIRLENEQLYFKYNGIEIPLRHVHFDLFKGRAAGVENAEDPETAVSFQLNKEGKINSLSVELEPELKEDILFNKEIPNQILSKSQLEKYTGEFNIGPQPVSFVIRKDNTLFALLPPQPDYELVYIGNDEFKLKVLDGYKIKFVFDAHGRVMEANFIQPNGIFTAKRKG